MKKVLLTVALSIISILSLTAQQDQNAQRLKYISMAPDGSVAMTIIDDTREDTMKIEAAETFYKYQILDSQTSESVLAEVISGRSCEIDKRKLQAGTYKIKLYTANFVITSKLTVSGMRKFNKYMDRELVAHVDQD